MGSFYVLELKQLFLLPLGTLEWWRQTWTAKDNCCRTVEENKVLFFWKPEGCVLIWTYLIWNYFHFRTVTKRLEITVFLDVNTDITKKNIQICAWNAQLAWWQHFPTRDLDSQVGSDLKKQWVLQSHLQLSCLQFRRGTYTELRG